MLRAEGDLVGNDVWWRTIKGIVVEAIEPYIREETPPASTTLVVRGGPITDDKLLQAAHREQAVYT